jgi:hypothetical protein
MPMLVVMEEELEGEELEQQPFVFHVALEEELEGEDLEQQPFVFHVALVVSIEHLKQRLELSSHPSDV